MPPTLKQEGQNQQLTEAPLAAKDNSKLVGGRKHVPRKPSWPLSEWHILVTANIAWKYLGVKRPETARPPPWLGLKNAHCIWQAIVQSM